MATEPRPGSKLFYKIGEASEVTKLPAYVLRFWESEFGFLKPRKTRGGQRLFSQRDIDTVFEIKRMLYEEGYTIAGVKRFWSRRGRRASGAGRPKEVAERIRGHLRAILRVLESYDRHSLTRAR